MSRSRDEYNAYMRDYLKARHARLRREMIRRLGGRCARCDGRTELQFDHIDRDTKEFDISRARSVSRKRLEAEITKCQLLCGRCHRLKSIECGDILAPVTHGSASYYKHHGCRCDPCRAANTARTRAYYAARPGLTHQRSALKHWKAARTVSGELAKLKPGNAGAGSTPAPSESLGD